MWKQWDTLEIGEKKKQVYRPRTVIQQKREEKNALTKSREVYMLHHVFYLRIIITTLESRLNLSCKQNFWNMVTYALIGASVIAPNGQENMSLEV